MSVRSSLSAVTGYAPVLFERFSELTRLPVGEASESPPILFHNTAWALTIYPGGISAHHRNVSLSLRKLSGDDCEVKFCYAVLDVHGNAIPGHTCNNIAPFYMRGDTPITVVDFATMDELLACTHEDTLTILASISFQPHQAGLQGDSLLTGINELAMNDKGENNLLRPSLRSLYEDGRVPHDVWLLCGPCEVSNEGHDVEKVGAHKFMLAARSPVFCAMFHGGMAESQGSEVRIEDFSASVVEAFVRFLYTDWCDYDVLQLCGKDLLAIADKYQVPALLELCESELISSLRPEDAVSLLKLADSHNAARLRARALEYIVDNAERTAQYAQELSPELMQDLLFAVAKRK